ncbi:hypothetical protein ACLMJK_007704 [Lecanora helva]
MASSARSRPSGTANRQSRGPIQLPAYQLLQDALSENAQRAVQNLSREHKLDSLKHRLKVANNHLTYAAADVNERQQLKNLQHEKQKKKLEKQGTSDDGQDRGILVSQQKTDEMTGKLESSVRMIIDSSAKVENTDRALRELQNNITEGRGRILPTQSTLGASYRPNSVRRPQGVDSSDEENNEGEEEEEVSPADALKQKIADKHSAYQSLSLVQRYAKHNDYIGFKKIVHDAQYPEDQAPPLPNASTWFPSQPSDPSNPNTQSASAEGEDSIVDDDEDIVIESEKISIKCPLTLLPMKDPVTSQKCSHSFEKEAILSMINASDERVGGSGRQGANDGQKAMKCPVCSVVLTASDLKENPVLVRKIKRTLAARNAGNEEFSDDEDNSGQGRPSLFRGGNRPEEVTSSPAATRTPRFKNERRSEAPDRQARQISMVPNSQVELVSDED